MAVFLAEDALAFARGPVQHKLIQEFLLGPVEYVYTKVGWQVFASLGICGCDMRSFQNLRKRMRKGGFIFIKGNNSVSMIYAPEKILV